MKGFNDYQKFLVKDIIITIFVVLITIPVWMAFSISSYAKEAKDYSEYNYIGYQFLNKKVDYSLNPTSDEDINNIETQEILVYNDHYTKDDYSLLLKINKNQDTNNLKIKVNDKINYVNTYNSFEKDGSIYYIIDSKNISATEKKYEVSLWNDTNATSNNESLDYDLIVDEMVI